MRGTELMRGSVRAAKCYGNIELSARHCEHVGRVVHHLIKRDERKTERHEFNDWPKPNHRGADTQARKSVLADWGVDDSAWPEPLEQPVAYLVSALIFRDLFPHQENIGVTIEFFRKGFVKCLAIRDFSHCTSSVVAAVSAADRWIFAGAAPASTAPFAYV